MARKSRKRSGRGNNMKKIVLALAAASSSTGASSSSHALAHGAATKEASIVSQYHEQGNGYILKGLHRNVNGESDVTIRRKRGRDLRRQRQQRQKQQTRLEKRHINKESTSSFRKLREHKEVSSSRNNHAAKEYTVEEIKGPTPPLKGDGPSDVEVVHVTTQLHNNQHDKNPNGKEEKEELVVVMEEQNHDNEIFMIDILEEEAEEDESMVPILVTVGDDGSGSATADVVIATTTSVGSIVEEGDDTEVAADANDLTSESDGSGSNHSTHDMGGDSIQPHKRGRSTKSGKSGKAMAATSSSSSTSSPANNDPYNYNDDTFQWDEGSSTNGSSNNAIVVNDETVDSVDNSGTSSSSGTFDNALIIGIDETQHMPKDENTNHKHGKSGKKGKSSKPSISHGNIHEESSGSSSNGGHHFRPWPDAISTTYSGKGGKANGGGSGHHGYHHNSSNSWSSDGHNSSKPTTKPSHGNHHNHNSWSNDGHHPPHESTHPSMDAKGTKLFKHQSSSGGSKSSKSSGGGWWSDGWPPVSSGKPTPSTSSKPTTKAPSTSPPSTSQPTPRLQPTTPKPTSPPSTLPPLIWKGTDGCTPTRPCMTCQGDCDAATDCEGDLECFSRSDSTQVPGCASGGEGDIPGADYCYDPGTMSPSLGPSKAPSSTGGSLLPTYSPTTVPDRPTPKPSITPPPQRSEPTVFPTYSMPTVDKPSSSPVLLPFLSWRGVDGCSPSNPCPACTGDCDTDSDCQAIGSDLACFKRADGETNQVLGCAVGGTGDVPGADYCYDVSFIPEPSSPTRSPVDTPNETLRPTPRNTLSPRPTRSPQQGTPGGSYFPTYSPQAGPPATMPSPPPSDAGAVKPYFIRSQATGKRFASSFQGSNVGAASSNSVAQMKKSDNVNSDEANDPRGRTLQDQQESPPFLGWCVSGALSPDYYQLLLEECTPDSLTATSASGMNNNQVVARMKQEDQLWSMDDQGYIHSIFDYDRCMMVPSTAMLAGDINEVAVEIGPCDDVNALNRFYYGSTAMGGAPNILKLMSIGYDDYCVTFLGGNAAAKGAPMILAPCSTEDKYGWDFVLESDLGEINTSTPTPPPTPIALPRLRYLGRDACNPLTPCTTCSGDCDTNSDCDGAFECFQRERGENTQVPGCAVGGPGDIAGADYCYDPTLIGGPTTVGPTPPSVATPTQTPTPLPPLNWLGAEGCTTLNPCPACTGDCDEDSDCEGLNVCYKRSVGETTQIPGCGIGGLGDVPGGDYCYNPNWNAGPPTLPTPEVSPPFVTLPATRTPAPVPELNRPPLKPSPSAPLFSRPPRPSPNLVVSGREPPAMPSRPTAQMTPTLPSRPKPANSLSFRTLSPTILDAEAVLRPSSSMYESLPTYSPSSATKAKMPPGQSISKPGPSGPSNLMNEPLPTYSPSPSPEAGMQPSQSISKPGHSGPTMPSKPVSAPTATLQASYEPTSDLLVQQFQTVMPVMGGDIEKGEPTTLSPIPGKGSEASTTSPIYAPSTHSGSSVGTPTRLSSKSSKGHTPSKSTTSNSQSGRISSKSGKYQQQHQHQQQYHVSDDVQDAYTPNVAVGQARPRHASTRWEREHPGESKNES